ncbi:MAG: peroxiredoxin, partial [Planctomycetota bacterium]|nr:peroxiredoxin [Planctomycetota bacterium]
MSNPSSPAANTAAPQAPSMPRIGDQAPDFRAMTTHGELGFREWAGGKWTLLFSHPADFTPVCSTELTELAKRNQEFEARNFKLIGVSIDSIHSHLAWVENLTKILGVELPYPLIADTDKKVAQLYGMMHPGESATVTVRALFFIDPKGTIRAIIYYPLNVGRNVDEILRVADALQCADGNGVACPVNWKKGDKVIVPPPKSMKEVAARKALKGQPG